MWLFRIGRNRRRSSMVDRRTFLTRGVQVLGAALLAWRFNGAAPAKPPTKPKKPVKPQEAWMNAKGMCAFPLAENEIPRTGAQLAQSMLGGWKSVFKFKDADKVVDFSGGRFPAVDSMTIDLSDAVVKSPQAKGMSVPDPVPTTQSVGCRQFMMLAEPMISGKSKLNMKVTGSDVRFDLQHDKSGNPILMLCDAKAGTVQFDITHDDLERIMLTRARAQASGFAVIVRDLDFKLTSHGPKSLDAEMHLSTLVGLIPAGIKFTARVDIDDQMNAKISNLTVEGDEAIGPLVVGLIKPGMAKYEGKTKPLLAFPAGNLKLKNVEVLAGDRVQLNAVFGS